MSESVICQGCKTTPATHTFPACLDADRAEANGAYPKDARWVHPRLCSDCLNFLLRANDMLTDLKVPSGELYQVGGFDRLD